MNKCKWTDGVLHICDDRAEEVRENITLAQEYYPFCKWCGADIREKKFVSDPVEDYEDPVEAV